MMSKKKYFSLVWCKPTLCLVLVLIFAAVLRLWWIDVIPSGIHRDELEFVLAAKAFWLTGKDASGLWNPLTLTTRPIGNPIAELTPVVVAPIIGMMEMSLLAAKIPYVINSLIMMMGLYLLTRHLFNWKVGILTVALFSINPWSFQFARMSFEAPISASFNIWAIYLMLSQKGWKVWWAAPLLFLGFYTYHGAKLTLVPLVVVVSVWKRILGGKLKMAPQISLIIFAGVLFGIYAVGFDSKNAAKRSEELIFLANNQAGLAVDHDRLHSLNSPLNGVMTNKITYMIRHVLSRELGVFSTELLFANGEPGGPYSTHRHGFFYPIDFILILIGLASIYYHRPRLAIMLVILGMIAPIPAILSAGGETYAHRANLLFPIMSVFVGYGFYIVATSKNRKWYLGIIVPMYVLFAINYCYLYFGRYPAYASEDFIVSERVLTNYLLKTAGQAGRVYVVNEDGVDLQVYKQFIFHSGWYNRQSAPEIAKNIQTENYVFKNISFEGACPDEESLEVGDRLIVHRSLSCPLGKLENERKVMIMATALAEPIYTIIGDKSCTKEELRPYIHPVNIGDFRIDRLSLSDLCKTWFIEDRGTDGK